MAIELKTTLITKVAGVFLLGLIVPSYGAEAPVVWADPTCNVFIAQLGDEFGVYESRAGAPLAEGDTIAGDLTGEGLVDIQNATKAQSNRVILVATSENKRALIQSAVTIRCQRRYQSN